MKVNIIFITLIIIFVFSGCSTDNGTIVVTNPIQKCKYIDTPYQAQESYYESEPYQAIEEYQEELKYQSSGSKTTFLRGFDVWAKGIVKIRNVDSETGSFTVKQTFSTLNNGKRTLQTSHYIMPGETVEFVENYDIDAGEDFNMNYVIIEPTKTLTKKVTKYRKVLKYRTVTKYKKEKVCN